VTVPATAAAETALPAATATLGHFAASFR
jgi:hypothetical protein